MQEQEQELVQESAPEWQQQQQHFLPLCVSKKQPKTRHSSTFNYLLEEA